MACDGKNIKKCSQEHDLCHWQLFFCSMSFASGRITVMKDAKYLHVLSTYLPKSPLPRTKESRLRSERMHERAKSHVDLHEFLNAKEFSNFLHTNAVINTKLSLN